MQHMHIELNILRDQRKNVINFAFTRRIFPLLMIGLVAIALH